MVWILNNKKGAEKWLSPWWFAVITIVIVGISIGVYLNYSADINVRGLEAKIMNQRISECIIKQGVIIDEFFDGDFDIFKKCNLNNGFFKEDAYFMISIFDEKGDLLKKVDSGGVLFEENCEILKAGVIAKRWAKCFSKTEDILYYSRGKIKVGSIKIVTASRNIGRRVPIK